MSNLLSNSCIAFGEQKNVLRLFKAFEELKKKELKGLGIAPDLFPETERLVQLEEFDEIVYNTDDEYLSASFSVCTNYTYFEYFEKLEEMYHVNIAVSVIDDSDGDWCIFHDPEQVHFLENVLLDIYNAHPTIGECYEFADNLDDLKQILKRSRKILPQLPKDSYDENDEVSYLHALDEYLRDNDYGVVRIAERL